MKTKKISLLLVLGLLGLALLGGCRFQGGDGDNIAPGVEVIVRPTPEGCAVDLLIGGDEVGDTRVDYPGVTAWRVTDQFFFDEVSASDDCSRVSFSAASQMDHAVERLWLRLRLTGASLVTRPRLVNAAGDNIFVIGPLEIFGQRHFEMEFGNIPAEGFSLSLDLLEIGDRLSYFSDHVENPVVVNPTEIFSMDPETMKSDQVTRDTPFSNGMSVWSPGGEWIALERSMELMCGDSVTERTQIFIVHPDGSNLTRVSEGMFLASGPQFNPSGNLIAYDCREGCRRDVVSYTNICVYDLRDRTQRVMFPGDGYWSNAIAVPRWSPDGTMMVMMARDSTMVLDKGGSGYYPTLWVYAHVDPATGTALDTPQPFFRQWRGDYVKKSGVFYFSYAIYNFTWAPDSKHAVIDYSYAKWLPAPARKWSSQYDLGIIDFAALLERTDLPLYDLPYTLAVHSDCDNPPPGHVMPAVGVANAPTFDRTGGQLWFHRFYDNGQADLAYVELNNYLPVSGEVIYFLKDGYNNRMPALLPPVLASFFPP